MERKNPKANVSVNEVDEKVIWKKSPSSLYINYPFRIVSKQGKTTFKQSLFVLYIFTE